MRSEIPVLGAKGKHDGAEHGLGAWRVKEVTHYGESVKTRSVFALIKVPFVRKG